MNKELEEWFYPHANQVAKAAGMPEWQGRIPILVEDAWNYQERFKMSYREACEKLYIENKEMKELIDWLWENEPEKTEMLDKLQEYLKNKEKDNGDID